MFTFEVCDDFNEGKEKLIAIYAFDNLEKAKEYARQTITKDDEVISL